MTRTAFTDLCQRFGVTLAVPAGIEGPRLLWAIGGCESSFGANAVPRHETAYCHGGRYFQADLDKQYGCWAHCSYGPWQLLYVNALALRTGISPLDMAIREELCAELVGHFLNREILGRQGAATLDQIGDAYNSGNFRDANVPFTYISRLKRFYAEMT